MLELAFILLGLGLTALTRAQILFIILVLCSFKERMDKLSLTSAMYNALLGVWLVLSSVYVFLLV